jgi:hypothetical protein
MEDCLYIVKISPLEFPHQLVDLGVRRAGERLGCGDMGGEV